MYEHAESFRSGALLGGIAGASEEISAAERMADQIGSAIVHHGGGLLDFVLTFLSAMI